MSLMERGIRIAISTCLAGLYLRGKPGLGLSAKRRWPRIYRALAAANGLSLGDLSACLSDAGLWEEASALDDPGVLGWALEQVMADRVLTAADEGYPCDWLRSLGSAAPCALWRRGVVSGAPRIAVVGSRSVTWGGASFARDCAREAMRLGATVVSGGAEGVDSIARDNALVAGEAARVIEILPHGLMGADAGAACQLSVCEPWARFTAGQAMERNALIYASSSVAVVVEPRYREGGTWHGAVDALRRRLCRVLVWDDGSPGADALIALGGVGVRDATSLEEWLGEKVEPSQPELFGERGDRILELAGQYAA